ncbi:MAG: hypothetical protein J0H73_04725, partial [Salana multivorans]|nr:hypothetical protein [Salana multivorans]
MPTPRRSAPAQPATQVRLTTRTPETADAQVLVVLLQRDGGSPRVLAPGASTLAEELADAVAALGLEGAADEVTPIPAPAIVTADVVVLAGLGDAVL